ncbi:PEPxxWA-CTERM sorting domain-containing protein [Aquisediminimonas profunda]|uniref:PEPxxWA-CTERM sorting domain-containing protein n=1 Tax=Aquisediminimonas profunda TaxID=1550733 RepID=UPI001FEB1EAD|nr:PEPxxWA-CTERM sorting domain-containing protein [Aquisediminimonas profunda]
MKLSKSLPLIALCAMAYAPTAASAAPTIKSYFEFKQPKMITIPGDVSLDTNGESAPVSNVSSNFTLGFEGISQYDGASFGRNFIPPDTMGAVGRTQYFETSNGAYAVFDKYTGQRLSLTSDVAFWAAAGQTGSNGDSRVMYNAAASRWIAVSFGANTKDLQIAISDTDDALGGWKSVKFEGYAGFGFGATADYPTLALDGNAVYIGTNNFAPASAGGSNSFRGTTLNVIPLDSLFGASAPTVTGIKQFTTDFPGTFEDRGFALQGVNSTSGGSTGKVLAASLFNYDSLGFTVNNLNSTDASGATLGAVNYLGQAAFQSPGPGRQPSVAIAANQRIISTLDERISSSVYEVNGRIYMVNTVDDLTDGLDESRVRYTVLDANTFAILDEGNIGEAGYDYYQGSIAVNEFGEVAIGYNRSGLDPTTGKISFMAQLFRTMSDGKLQSMGDQMLLKESLVDDYHNGSLFGQPAAGRQRWGDYSQVSVDPSNAHNFYLIGQFAREYNNAAGGHPGGTGGSRWGTFIAVLTTPVPEPQTWAMMVFGFGFMGYAMRRRRYSASFA